MAGPLGVIRFTGIAQLMILLRKLRGAKFGEAWVGSAVVYGPMQEFGTKHMRERPHWRVAIPEIVARYGGEDSLQEALMDGLVGDGDPAPIRIAIEIERRVKQIIKAKGIWDLGNYHGSIATGRTEQEAFGASASKSDPATVSKANS